MRGTLIDCKRARQVVLGNEKIENPPAFEHARSQSFVQIKKKKRYTQTSIYIYIYLYYLFCVAHTNYVSFSLIFFYK